jgi:hypothetical protein
MHMQPTPQVTKIMTPLQCTIIIYTYIMNDDDDDDNNGQFDIISRFIYITMMKEKFITVKNSIISMASRNQKDLKCV